MRAILCKSFGEPETLVLEEMPAPQPQSDETLIAVKASAVNFADTLVIRDGYQNKPPLPFVPGLEVAGEIIDAGANHGIARGDRVMGFVPFGGFAERAVVPARHLFPIPDGMDFATAAAFPTTYATAHVGLKWEARLARGETLLVLGAAGGVGLAAVEIGKAMGAIVIAAASSADKLAIASDHGADRLVNYGGTDIREPVMEATRGRGVDVVLDPVGGKLFDSALSCLDWGGRIVVTGFAGGIPRIPANRLLVKNRSALGLSLDYYRRDANDRLRQSMSNVSDFYCANLLKPLVSHRLPLERAAAAIRLLMDRKATGKVVIEMSKDA